MLAAVVDRFGSPDVVKVREVPMPGPPKAHEVLVRVEAAAVTAGDARVRAARFPAGFGLVARPAVVFRGPRVRILGSSISGVVDRVGADVSEFSPGDEVAGMTGARMRAHADFALAPVASLARKPEKVSHSDAAGIIFGGTTALYFLRDRAKVTAGESVLVNGASGAVGSAAVQLARHFGGVVTAVASARNRDFLLRIGAEHVVDYAATPIDTLADRFDVVLDTVGNISRSLGLKLATDQGRVALVAASLKDTIRAGGRVFADVAPERADDIDLLLRLLDSGEIDAVTEVAGGGGSRRCQRHTALLIQAGR